VNLGEATARGLELSASLRPVTALALRASYTRLWTEVTAAPGGSLEFLAGGPLLRRPAGSARVDASVRVEGLAFGAGITLVGARDDIDFSSFERVSLPAHATVDAGGEVDLLGGSGQRRLALLVRVENALGASYETVVGFPARGRTLLFGVRAGL
jgi:outer membrane receptor protein involved in Fe transport